MPNSLDLDPEWGAIDLIEEIEEAFAIKIGDEEAERCWTVGDLYDVICAHAPHWDEQSRDICPSSYVFYRFRRSLVLGDRTIVSPRSSLQQFGTATSRLFASLGKDTGLRLPTPEATIAGRIGGWMCLIGFVGGLAALFSGAWLLSGAGVLLFGSGAALGWIDPARPPKGMETVGELVHRVVPLNVQKLRRTGARTPDRWTILIVLATEYGSLPPEEITRHTFLLRRGMELAVARSI